MSNIPVRTIAGLNAGIRVTINANLYPVYQNMKSLATEGNHWARICVNHLEALSSGQFKKYVYVQCNGNQEDFGEYSIILPGCRASFRKNSTGTFYIYSLVADGNYAQLQKDKKKPGLFNVRKDHDKWETKIVSSGNVKERKINVIAISDQISTIEDAVVLAPDAISQSGQASKSALSSNGFDLHFTPGKRRIGGLVNLKQSYGVDTDASLHESAILLASTMETARTIKDVTWVSERGGSGVLTQAMRILKDRGVSFNDKGHKAFFSQLRTNLGTAEQLARDIGIEFDGASHSKDMLNVNHVFGSGIGGGFINPVKRYFKEDKYSALNLISDVAPEVSSHKTAIGAAAGTGAIATGFHTSATALGATLGTSIASLSGPGLVFGAVVAATAASVAVYKGINAVGKSYFPLAYHKKLIGRE